MNKIFNVKQKLTPIKKTMNGIFMVDPPDLENYNTTIYNNGFYYSPLGKYTEIKQNSHIYQSKLAINRLFTEKNVGRFSCTSAFGVEAITELEPSPIIGAIPTQLHAELINNKFNKLSDNKKHKTTILNNGFEVNLSWRQPSILAKFNENYEVLSFF